MSIVPDTKNWTWILETTMRRVRVRRPHRRAVRRRADGARATSREWQRVLAAGSTCGPTTQTWSPLEYGCHVRDVFRIMTTRVDLVVAEPDPLFPNWDQDGDPVEAAYDTQDPARVAVELADAGWRLPTGSTTSPTNSGRADRGGAVTVLSSPGVRRPLHAPRRDPSPRRRARARLVRAVLIPLVLIPPV